MKGKLNEMFINGKKIDFEPTRFSELSGASEDINKEVERRVASISNLVEKTLKNYCEISKVNFETMKKNKSLTREIHPNHESFFHHGIEIFRMDIRSQNFNNEGCTGIETTYSIREFF